ncbi:glycosyltransferase family 4 protein [Muriicola soli]|uniref:Glycosyl transferase family 1 n=1 Tax=Muriicola soli TaxID=2507538 RepID=A0A411E9Z6_9FLAO|nr:glycosyltransferase family 4 protein [Muriicola soli]QBA64280.1 glycosyl transferase family 1 [Muriicola soli]
MKKVLIVTYYWPPAGGPGVQRWLNFVKYLPDSEIQPVLYIPENPHYPILDHSLKEEVPDQLTIYRQPIWEPYQIASIFSKKKTKKISSGIVPSNNPSFLDKVFLWVRGNLFIPDARKYWIGPSVRVLTEILESEEIETVITTGPPHSLHLIGKRLKERTNIKWIADFRDPWTSIGYHKALRLTRQSQKKHKELEQEVLHSADQILVTSNTTKQEFEAITHKPVITITNGYDQAAEGKIIPDTHFTISHIGSLLSERNPYVLWKVLADLVSEEDEFAMDLRIKFTGVVSDEIVNDIQGFGLGSNLEVTGYLPHKEAVLSQRKSQILLLVEIDSEETRGIIPGKLFEYMAAQRPILAIGPKSWEAGSMVRESACGEVFTYNMEAELKTSLLKWYKAYKGNSLKLTSENMEQYSRKALTKKLAAYI